MGRYDAGRFTTHKVRAEWFQERTSYPWREVYPPALESAPARQPLVWRELGPLNSGGRLTSLVVRPDNPDVVYVGAAAGGVWRSEDAGHHWVSIWGDQMPTLNIGSLTMDPGNPDIIYCGTGEATGSADNYPGVGVFRGRWGPEWNWQQIGFCSPTHPTQEGKPVAPIQVLPRRIGSIAVDPFDSNHILTGGITNSKSQSAGLFETRDGGNTWGRAPDRNSSATLDDSPVFVSAEDYYCHAAVFHPDVKGLVIASVEARGALSGIWYSTDGGLTWAHAVKGLPPSDQFGRVRFAIARGSKRIYALVGATITGGFLGVFRSDDLGRSWVLRGSCAGLSQEGQLFYTNCIAVDPSDPDVAVAGSVNLYRTRDGGKRWLQISVWDPVRSRRYAHADHHALAIVGDRIYSAGDGGMAVSEDRGSTWQMRNNGLAVAMFYAFDVAPTNSSCLGGGMQDLGTWFTGPLNSRDRDVEGSEARAVEFRRQRPGDGGWVVYDPDNETHVFASAQRMILFRHRDGKRWRRVRKRFPKAERSKVFVAVLAMDISPSARKPRTLYIGSTRVWRSRDDAESWFPVSPFLDGSTITALEVAPANPTCIYAGTVKGGFFRSLDGGRNWSKNLAGPGSADRTITRIETSPTDASEVCYTVGSVAEEVMRGATPSYDSSLTRAGLPFWHGDTPGFVEYYHVFGSRNSGDTWDSIDSSRLPNLPYQAAVFSNTPKRWLFVGYDGGVQMMSADGTWHDVTSNLPNTRVTDIVYHEKDRLLFASTYGRGIWSIPLDQLEEFAAGSSEPADSKPPLTTSGTENDKTADLQRA